MCTLMRTIFKRFKSVWQTLWCLKRTAKFKRWSNLVFANLNQIQNYELWFMSKTEKNIKKRIQMFKLKIVSFAIIDLKMHSKYL